ncbi:YobA family protein [Chryseomicrobium palamuruense]
MSQTINEDFRGEVIELNEDSFLMEYSANDFVLLKADASILEELTVGDLVIVEVDGGIDESDPLQAAAKKVEVVDSAN